MSVLFHEIEFIVLVCNLLLLSLEGTIVEGLCLLFLVVDLKWCLLVD